MLFYLLNNKIFIIFATTKTETFVSFVTFYCKNKQKVIKIASQMTKKLKKKGIKIWGTITEDEQVHLDKFVDSHTHIVPKRSDLVSTVVKSFLKNPNLYWELFTKSETNSI